MNILAIGAHFDDVELGCGGSLIKHVEAGDKVIILVITHSDYADLYKVTQRTREQALIEGRNAAEIIGAELKHGSLENKKVQYNWQLIEIIEKTIINNNIDLIYTHWLHDIHQDHSAIARATLTAGRHVPNILMYRSNWYASIHEFHGNFFQDISTVIKKKIEAVKAHKTEYIKRGDKWIDFFVNNNRNSGQQMGIEFAECFEIVKFFNN